MRSTVAFIVGVLLLVPASLLGIAQIDAKDRTGTSNFCGTAVRVALLGVHVEGGDRSDAQIAQAQAEADRECRPVAWRYVGSGIGLGAVALCLIVYGSRRSANDRSGG